MLSSGELPRPSDVTFDEAAVGTSSVASQGEHVTVAAEKDSSVSPVRFDGEANLQAGPHHKDPQALVNDAETVTNKHGFVFKRILYHDEANLRILVRSEQGENVIYEACEALLSAASPAWQKAFESHISGIIFNLPNLEGQTYGMDVVLLIIHRKLSKIPHRPEIHQLYSIARVAEEYDCTHLLVPFMKEWMRTIKDHDKTEDPGREGNNDGKMLYITWVFGAAREWISYLTKVWEHTSLSGDGTLLDSQGQPWKDQGLPPLLLELIKRIRHKAVAKICNISATGSTCLFNPSKNAQNISVSAENGNGTPTRCRTRSANTSSSAACLAKAISAINSPFGVIPWSRSDEHPHSLCGSDRLCDVWDAQEGISLLPLEFVELLKSRAQKSGAYSLSDFSYLEQFVELKELATETARPEALENLALYYNMTSGVASVPGASRESKDASWGL